MARILIVEDDLLCRNIMTRALLQRGHDVRAAPDGPTAQEVMRETRFDALIGTDAVVRKPFSVATFVDSRGAGA